MSNGFERGIFYRGKSPQLAPDCDRRSADLLELAHADDEFTPAERDHIEAVLRRHFALDEDTARELLQLAELEAYDRILDSALERSYRDLRVNPLRSRWEILNDLREIRIDLARMSDEVSNITKFFGDWHLARIYQTISARFHLPDWHRTIDEKLQTLDNFYQLFKHDQTNRWMLILETTIVLLFIIDLLVLFMGLKRP